MHGSLPLSPLILLYNHYRCLSPELFIFRSCKTIPLNPLFLEDSQLQTLEPSIPYSQKDLSQQAAHHLHLRIHVLVIQQVFAEYWFWARGVLGMVLSKPDSLALGPYLLCKDCSLLVVGGRIMAPEDVHVLIPAPGTVLPSVAGQDSEMWLSLEILKWGDYPGSSGWAQCNYKGKKEAGESRNTTQWSDRRRD